MAADIGPAAQAPHLRPVFIGHWLKAFSSGSSSSTQGFMA